MKELNLIYEASRKLEYLTSDRSPIRNITLKAITFDMIVHELSMQVMHTEAIKQHAPNNYFIYCGITFLKEKT